MFMHKVKQFRFNSKTNNVTNIANASMPLFNTRCQPPSKEHLRAKFIKSVQ